VKTLLITGGGAPLPQALRDVIARGSTEVRERAARDVDGAAAVAGVDRVVFWSAGDEATRKLAAQCALAERRDGRETIVFVTTAAGDEVAGLSPAEMFEWPGDEDRLTMAFMTGA
jgi:hypothetical protein